MNNEEKDWVDPIVAEVRAVRDELARRFNYDVSAICRYYREKEKEGKKQGRHYVTRPPKLLRRKPTGTDH